MSKRHKKKPTSRNPIARFMNKVNKPSTHKNKNTYSRKNKHKTRINHRDNLGFSRVTIIDMIILYTKSTCPFCHKVTDYFDDKGIDYESRDVYESDIYMEELLQAGGKRQIPFLIDGEHGVSMYESEDIIQYVKNIYGENPEII